MSDEVSVFVVKVIGRLWYIENYENSFVPI